MIASAAAVILCPGKLLETWVPEISACPQRFAAASFYQHTSVKRDLSGYFEFAVGFTKSP